MAIQELQSKLSKLSLNSEPQSIFNISLGHEVNANLCSKMVIGIVKYILYNRDQIPEPLDQLTKLLEQNETKEITTLSKIRGHLHQNKVKAIVKIFTEIFEYIHHAIREIDRTEIRKVVVMLGATVFTPKEVHCIEIPSHLALKLAKTMISSKPETSSSFNRQMTSMFRALMMSANGKSDLPCMSPTNITVLVQMRRDNQIDWFLPKVSYSLPKKGRYVVYKLDAPPEIQVHSHGQFTIYQSPAPSNVLPMKEVQDKSEEDFIWFQVPHVAKGFLDKI